MDQLLYVFIKVVEKGNFTKAAEELHMTQPAVSQHIQARQEKRHNTHGKKRTPSVCPPFSQIHYLLLTKRQTHPFLQSATILT